MEVTLRNFNQPEKAVTVKNSQIDGNAIMDLARHICGGSIEDQIQHLKTLHWKKALILLRMFLASELIANSPNVKIKIFRMKSHFDKFGATSARRFKDITHEFLVKKKKF